MPTGDYTWIEDAAREYGRSAKWLRKQVSQGKLTPYKFPGDQKLYLARAELTAFLAPKPRDGEPVQ